MKILVVEDEDNIRELVRAYLEREGYGVVEAADGTAALDLATSEQPDLVVLDLMLPGIDGWEICRRLRQGGATPVIMLTARGDEIDRILGLELGADDYLTKPFSPRELVARVKAVLRRSSNAGAGAGQQAAGSERLVYPDFDICRTSREVRVRGEAVPMPAKEFDLLWMLAANPNHVFSREHLLERVWGYDFYGDLRTVDVHIRRLREKIEPDPDHPRYLVTVWGVGYKFQGVNRGGQ